MKRSLAIIALCALFNGFLAADATIGKCHFTGERPPRSMSIGSTTVYYHEMSSSSVSRGGVEYKQCTGDVWVIYRSASDAKHLQFQTTNGSVQTCNDY